MKEYIKQKLILIGLMLLFYYIIETIAFLWIGFQPLPKFFLVDFIFITLVALPILIIPSTKYSVIYMSVWLLFVNGLFVTNANIFSVYFELFTLEQFKLLGEATDILNLDYIYVPAFIVFLIVASVYVIVVKFVKKCYLSEKPTIEKRRLLHLIPIYIALSLALVVSFSLFDTGALNDFSDDQTLTTLKRDSMKQYGLLAYYYKEAEILYFGNGLEDDFVYIDKPSQPSPYFGLLEGYNVFTIMIESGEEYAINEYLTPNLYQMTQDGLYFENHYSENKTNVSEVIGMVGHYPPQSFDTENYNYTFESSIPVILNDTYETAYFHDNYPLFYGRGDTLEMIGFEHIYFHDELYDGEPRWEWDGNLTLDSVTADKIIEQMFKTNDPFYYYWTTLLTHGPYNEGAINAQLFIDLGYQETLEEAEEAGLWINPLQGYDGEDKDDLFDRMKYFQMAMMDLDVAIGKLMDELETRGELDQTLFVLYGDHTAYYNHFNHIVLDQDEIDESYYNMNLYTTFYTIYNPTLTNEYLKTHESNVVDKFVSPYTIVPTVLDLLGQTYNQQFMVGDHIFSDLEHVFYSNKLTTFFTDKLYSDNGYDIVYQNGFVSDMYFEEFIYQSDTIVEKMKWINDYYLNTRTEIEE
jgi:phosphoglycerol transferase MdoB-like AlkP superfamily enzyme